VGQPGVAGDGVEHGEPGGGPVGEGDGDRPVSSTTGEGETRASSAYRRAISGQSVADHDVALACAAAMAACSWYGTCPTSAPGQASDGLPIVLAVGDVYKALADPTRRTILDELAARDGQTLFELCARLAANHGLGSTRQAISQHIDVLKSAGLVTTRREGRCTHHQIDTSPLRQISERWPAPDQEERP
jgi:hypothetical protein